MRDFDYNLDGLSHYGMLPDMLQDLKNVGLPDDGLRRSSSGRPSATSQVWERSVQVGGEDPAPGRR